MFKSKKPKSKHTFERRRPEAPVQSSFKRYRTLIAPKVAQESSERSKKRSLVVTRRRVVGLFVIVGLAGVLMTIILFQFVGIVKVASVDPAIKPDKSYQETIEQYYRAHPVERLRFLLDTQRLRTVIQTNHHEVSDMDLQPVAIGEAQFVLNFRQPTASWKIDGKQQYVDQDGVIFARNYYQKPGVKIIDKSGLQRTNSSGGAVASRSFLSFTGRLVGYGERYRLPIESVTIPRNAIRNIEVKFANKPYTVKMNTGSEVGEQFEDTQRSMEWIGSHKSNVKSIDVRVSRRAAYR